MIRAVFFDLDGTLLDSGKRIPDSARMAIAACRARGVRMYYATARSPRLDKMLGFTAADFALFDGGICSNGACVMAGGETQYCYIDPRAVRRCMDLVSACGDVHLSLHMPDEGYAFNFEPDASMDRSWGLSLARVCPLDEMAVCSTVKMLVFYNRLTDSTRALPPVLMEAIRSECGGLAKIYVTDEGRTVQLAGLEAGKLTAIERIRRSLGLTREEVAVFGDDVNDLEMIVHYPHSVAMGNAVPQVKAAAGYVTRSNDDDGVAYALQSLLPMP